MQKIKKVLIANRGEIALRIMRSLKEMGINTVAVFSEADRLSPHVQYADEAVCIGPAPSSASYLNSSKIIETALKLRADAIHPGYGFLSENESFARLVEESGLIFIGPSANSIKIMGSKLAAKDAAAAYNIPMVPGINKPITDINEALRVTSEIGYPVLIKASAGGGGKGMRIVERPEEFAEQLERASSEAKSAFGDGSVFIEKYIASPKHIEVQVLGDQHGNVIHLFERECSIQRRYQKVVEEAPSPVLNHEKRMAIGKAAVKVAKSCNYYGAGTVEFIVDEQLNFYFLEMNTRLQVEHPVTEMITGIDLVKEQINIAEGNTLSYKQEDISIRGHAIELRVYAEDPANNFLPDIGKLITYKRPQGPGIRVDDGFEEYMEIPVFYDPMIAKLITYGSTRTEAIQRMKRAISEYKISGIMTTLPFGTFVMGHEAFISGKFDTHFVKKHFSPENLKINLDKEGEEIAMAFAGKFFTEKISNKSATENQSTVENSVWKRRYS
ncbi:MAG: acetyl-CoA carboxylase biotin carboxylase subunit [Sporocytophaga sp.]|nr:acetyl-CoA carboxylase biotin carboxylase subunit [Sporocytophaga sp.]